MAERGGSGAERPRGAAIECTASECRRSRVRQRWCSGVVESSSPLVESRGDIVAGFDVQAIQQGAGIEVRRVVCQHAVQRREGARGGAFAEGAFRTFQKGRAHCSGALLEASAWLTQHTPQRAAVGGESAFFQYVGESCGKVQSTGKAIGGSRGDALVDDAGKVVADAGRLLLRWRNLAVDDEFQKCMGGERFEGQRSRAHPV